MGKGHIFGTPVPSVTQKNFLLQNDIKTVCFDRIILIV